MRPQRPAPSVQRSSPASRPTKATPHAQRGTPPSSVPAKNHRRLPSQSIAPAVTTLSSRLSAARYERASARTRADLVGSAERLRTSSDTPAERAGSLSRLLGKGGGNGKDGEMLLKAFHAGGGAELLSDLSIGALGAVLDSAGRQRADECAAKVFAELLRRTIGGKNLSAELWAARMQASGDPTVMEALYSDMLRAGHAPSTAPLSMLISVLAHHSRLEALQHRLSEAEQHQVPIRLPVLGMACVALAKGNMHSQSLRFFQSLISIISSSFSSPPSASALSSTATRIVQAFCRTGRLPEALQIAQSHALSAPPEVLGDVIRSLGYTRPQPALQFYALLSPEVQRSAAVGSALLGVQARHLMVAEAAALHPQLEASGAQVNASVLLDLIRAYGMTGRAMEVEQAFALYTQRTSPRDQAYEILLTALCRAGASHAALQHAKAALEAAIPLSDATVTALRNLLQPHRDLSEKFSQLLLLSKP